VLRRGQPGILTGLAFRFTTVGFGDITAKSEAARVVLIVQMLADLVLLGAGVRVLLGAVQRGRERRSDTGDVAGQASRSTSQ